VIKRIAILAVLLLAGIGAFWYARSRKRSKSLELSGAIEARDVEVGSLVGGRVLTVAVDEGAAVVAGQTIVTFEPDLLDRQIEEQRAQIDQQRANLARTVAGPRREEVDRARVAWENAETEWRRQEALRNDGVVSAQQYDTVSTAAKTARKTYQELARGSRSEDVDQARAMLRQADEHLQYLIRQRGELVVKAPADGVIQTIDLRPGDLVAANRPVATILEPSQTWVRVFVPEPGLGRVRQGEKVSIYVDSFPNRAFAGTVVEIRQQAEYTPRNVQTLDQRADQVFGVKIAIEPAPELKPGMAATVKFVDR
jgi:multidrug resistance efflux pump